MEIEESVEKKKKVKKRKPIFVYFILMILLFFILFGFQNIISQLILLSIIKSPGGTTTLIEIVSSGLVLLVVLLYGNKYIFTQKKEKFSKSLKYIAPHLICSVAFLIYSILIIIGRDNPISVSNLVNKFIFCLFIGIFEEFLCRGWLLNEFLERYSDSKKGVILSIILSSLIFGLWHYGNLLLVGRGFIDVTMQVINATVMGMFFALVYYKTKNIWVVVASHALWDFTLMFEEINSFGDAVIVGTSTSSMMIFSILQIFALVCASLLFCYWVFRQTDLYSKGNTKKKNWLVICGCIIYIAFFSLDFSPEGYYLFPEYSNKLIEDNYDLILHVNNDESKNVVLENTSFELELDKDMNLNVINSDTDRSYEIEKEVMDFIIVENDKEYDIFVKKTDNTVLYGKFKFSDEKDSEFVELIKKNVKLYATPTITQIFVLQTENSQYNYIAFNNDASDILYFDEDGKLMINK